MKIIWRKLIGIKRRYKRKDRREEDREIKENVIKEWEKRDGVRKRVGGKRFYEKIKKWDK